MNAILTSTLVLPAQATASAFTSNGKHLAVGSDDGSLRLYRPPDAKVQKAIRGLGASVASALIYPSTDSGGEDNADLWVASGKSVYRFDFASTATSNKMILTRSDASLAKDIGQDDEDVINQLALSANRAYLACTTDTGGTYVLDVTSPSFEVSRMKTSHESIAWTAAFIPDRPSELLTGGYDCTLLLHDFKLRTLLARFDIAPAPSLAPGISSLPPFITSLALSSYGAVAVGTADGRIWIGSGGIKPDASSGTSGSGKKNRTKTKKIRKWGGLNEAEGFFVKVGEGMIAGLQFITPATLLSSSVHGKLELHHLTSNLPPSAPTSRQGTSQDLMPPGGLRSFWSAQSSCAKVEVLTCTSSPISKNQVGVNRPGEEVDVSVGADIIATVAVTGLHEDKKRGAVELWEVRRSGAGTNAGENDGATSESRGLTQGDED